MPETPEHLARDLVAAVEILGEVFEKHHVCYALLGGLATMLRGRQRFTQDVDVLLEISQLALPGILDELVERGFALDRDTVIRQFVQEHMTAFRYGVVRIYWLKPVLPLYAHALAAATPLPLGDSRVLRVLTPEGLIITKMVAFRPQDQEDISTLLAANHDEIDGDLIRREWASVSLGEEDRTAWLEMELTMIKR